MTIALGILASNGLVIAADTQETYAGVFKLDQGKILGCINDTGSLVVAGAGSAAHSDALMQELCDAFSREKPNKAGDVAKEIADCVHAFNAKHILPWAGYNDYERPSVSLIVGASVHGLGRIWTTDKSVVRRCDYGAIGLGAAQANVLLNRLCRPRMNLNYAVVLAAYVVYCVKQEVDGCGQQTHVVVIRRDQAATWKPARVQQLEDQFAAYRQRETAALQYGLGASGVKAPRISGAVVQLRKAVRELPYLPVTVTDRDRLSAPKRWIADSVSRHSNRQERRHRRRKESQ